MLPRLLHRHPATGRPGYWAAEDRGTGRFLGWFAFRPLDDGGAEVELGYRLRRAAWGRGLATEGARALVDDGFAGPLLQRVCASTMTVNAASRRVLERTGLRLVRTVHLPWPEVIDGSEHGDVEYALTRAEWAARR
ncbi:GNAT family N-acetyltransferase [Geodermatophilus sp. DSM 44513]|uniref:GNAT family N-acetyltransferase n=1 Tax=Geodermatophilus sp. DSM 44513 TaxID=1528104 RepID=UPI0012896E47|nr:GNAT family N-acetyltransferase [Geodermatophilus sp. DSM 44513]WNV73666.1 GNAT family N-acetyltransferase [Geodermatophilus sp. DSM 44513]